MAFYLWHQKAISGKVPYIHRGNGLISFIFAFVCAAFSVVSLIVYFVYYKIIGNSSIPIINTPKANTEEDRYAKAQSREILKDWGNDQ